MVWNIATHQSALQDLRATNGKSKAQLLFLRGYIIQYNTQNEVLEEISGGQQECKNQPHSQMVAAKEKSTQSWQNDIQYGSFLFFKIMFWDLIYQACAHRVLCSNRAFYALKDLFLLVLENVSLFRSTIPELQTHKPNTIVNHVSIIVRL